MDDIKLNLTNIAVSLLRLFTMYIQCALAMTLVKDAITFLKRYNLHNANSRNNAPVIKNKAATPFCPLSTKPAPLIQPLKEKL